MKRFLILFSAFCLIFGMTSSASALYFSDKVTDWGPKNYDKALVPQAPKTLKYTHDIRDDVDLKKYKVTEAWLELDFDCDTSDSYYFGKRIKWDFREYAYIAFDGNSWQYVDEVDNNHEHLTVGIDWLNDDGRLDVSLTVTNKLKKADAWLDWSELTGNATAVPEPATMLLLGFGLLGLAGAGRNKFRKK